jgi:hypothetical protein
VGGGGRDKFAVEQRLCGVMFLCYDSIYRGNKKMRRKYRQYNKRNYTWWKGSVV